MKHAAEGYIKATNALSGRQLNGPHRKILAYDVAEGGRAIENRRVLIDAEGGTPDGMRCDVDGNLWCGWGMGSEALDGVMVFAPDGTKIGRIALPERCANVCFGGRHRNRLFMAAAQSLYSLYVNTQGALGGVRRRSRKRPRRAGGRGGRGWD